MQKYKQKSTEPILIQHCTLLQYTYHEIKYATIACKKEHKPTKKSTQKNKKIYWKKKKKNNITEKTQIQCNAQWKTKKLKTRDINNQWYLHTYMHKYVLAYIAAAATNRTKLF